METDYYFSGFFRYCNFYNREEKNTCFRSAAFNLRSKAVCLEAQLKSEFDSALAWLQFHTKAIPEIPSHETVTFRAVFLQILTQAANRRAPGRFPRQESQIPAGMWQFPVFNINRQ